MYMGRQALELGLVDKLGTLDDAVKFAAREAKLEKYERRVVPEPKNLLEKLLEGTSAADQDEDEVCAADQSAGRIRRSQICSLRRFRTYAIWTRRKSTRCCAPFGS